jgi:triosephosphate isomerase
MRKPFVAGNWKMHKTLGESLELASRMLPELEAIFGVDSVICPPFTSLSAVSELLKESVVSIGAQNVHWEPSGPYTGEISPPMLVDLCEYVIIGHSERRAYFYEIDETVNKKVKAVLANDMVPIVCIGETLDENDAGLTAEVVSRQLDRGLDGLGKNIFDADEEPLIVAYEPVWAIGTGRAATVEVASNVISDVIRPVIASKFSLKAAERIRILYGGSVKANNAAEFFGNDEIDGGLIGGASLKSEEFVNIVRAAQV